MSSGQPALRVITDRPALVRRAVALAWVGLAWHLAEAAISLVAGAVAGSIALVGFGADSVVEFVAGGAVLWRFSGGRAGSRVADDRARRWVAICFYAIAAWVAVEALRSLLLGDRPEASAVGVALAAFTLATMPLLARAKLRVADALRSDAAAGEARQTMLCAYLSAALLAGLAANAVLGWWWADPLAALVIAGLAAREGRSAWLGGEGCCSMPDCGRN